MAPAKAADWKSQSAGKIKQALNAVCGSARLELDPFLERAARELFQQENW